MKRLTVEQAMEIVAAREWSGDLRVIVTRIACAGTVLAREVERLQAELAVTANALERACTPPFPSHAGPPGVHSTLVNFYLRRAREAAEAKEADRGQGD